jgi:hypothetical protein
MLDVHPQHEAAHTWKDFFIHIATIVVGLIIAVGLEQTVEAIHHHHQRRELEENLHRDGELNRGWANQDLESAQKLREWAQSQAILVEHAPSSGPLALQPIALANISTPNFGVFLAARANGQMSLLSTWQQNMQGDLNRVVDQIFISDLSFYRRLRSSLGDLNQVLLGYTIMQTSGLLDVSSLSPPQREELAKKLLAVAEAARQFESAVVDYGAENQLLLDSPEEPDRPGKFEQLFNQAQKPLSAAHPGTDYIFTTH